MAKEIECNDGYQNDNINRHLLEERNIVNMRDYDENGDEEDLYSAVYNDPNKNNIQNANNQLNTNQQAN